jgi:fibronectin-binding autotransporter adhesin
MRAVSLIEPLEDRIAPASLVTIAPNGKSATYTDSTGDKVVVTTTKGAFTSGQFTFDPTVTGQLTELTLAGHSAFTGANIVFTVFPVNGGSASVNVGYIDALNLNLGGVTLPGDLGRIDAGGGATAAALGKLTINSLGAFSTTQNGLTFSSISNITGTVGQVNIAGNLDGAIFSQNYNGIPGTGNIGLLNVGGSVDGNTSSGGPGVVFFTGTLGTAVIAGGIEGGSGSFSGSIAGYESLSGGLGTFSKIGSITVKGSVPDDPNPNPLGLPGTSILGGLGDLSGGIIADTIGTVRVAGDVFGGTGIASGFIEGPVKLGTVNIAGSVLGGNFTTGNPTEAASSGLVFGGTIGSVTIGKNLFGGSGIQSGEILSTGFLQKVTVMGDVAGGSAGTASTEGLAGSIRAHVLGSVVIQGSLIGGNLVSGDANQTGSGGGTITSDTTIGSIYIGKDMVGGSGPSSAQITTLSGAVGTIMVAGATTADGILGGSGASSGSINLNGAIGKLIVTGNLTGGSGAGSGLISANAMNSLVIGGNVTGGTADSTGLISAFGLLANANIKGNITGSSSGATMLTNTGYVQADGIGVMTVGGALMAGTAGSGGLDTSGAIRSTTAIGSITLGSLVGNATNPAIISAVGPANLAANATTDVAMGIVTVKGNATYGDILAGYSTDTQNSTVLLGTGVNADAQIGTVTIGGNLTATNIIAGVGAGTNGSYGNASSAGLSGAGVTDLPSIISKISRIVITGAVDAPAVSTTDTYGIAAQYIVSATVNAAKVALTAGPDNDTFANHAQHPLLGGGNGEVFLYEV